MLSVNTNLAALQAQSAQQTNARSTATAMQQLSTSKRINSAVDDVAGLAISTRLMSQIKGANQAIRNTNDGISLLQTADGALEGITNALQRMRELRVQSLNETNNSADKASIENEITSMQTEIDRILSTTEFNGIKILNGSTTASQAGGAPTTSGFNFTTGSNGETQNVSLSSLASPTPVFTKFDSLQIGTDTGADYSKGLVIGDFNGDGNPDIGVQVQTTQPGPMLSEFEQGSAVNQWKFDVSFGDGKGNFSAQASSLLGSPWTNDGPPPYHSMPMPQDFNGDGRSDYADVTSTTNGSGLTEIKLNVRLSNYDGTLGPDKSTSYSNVIDAFPLTTGDFNGDGKMDIMVSSVPSPYSPDQSSVAVYLGDGNGGFQQTASQSIIGYPSSVQTGDFNADGKLDYAAVINSASGRDSSVSIFLGLGDGTFYQPTKINTIGTVDVSHSLAVGDFNQDGTLDLAITTSPKTPISIDPIFGTPPDLPTVSSELSIFQGIGDGSFKKINTIALANDAIITVSSDFNGDGNHDLAITYTPTTTNMITTWNTNLQILTGNGDFLFRFEKPIPFVSQGNIQVGSNDINGTHAARTAVYLDVSPFWRLAFYMFVFQAA